MKILVVGSGGREHAICRAFEKDQRVKKIYCADGNAGIAESAECVSIKPAEIEKLADFAEREKIDITFVGGETALASGIVDEFESRNLKIIGASRAAARLESSKSFAKDFMRRHNIPTADYHTAQTTAEALEIINSGRFGGEDVPVVIKADGLAAGKGVVVANNKTEAVRAVEELETIAGKSAVEKIIIEECLFGKEVSLILFSDGENFALMPPARDHKRIGENDTGANTGGMGTICDDALLTPEQTEEIVERIIKPTLKGAGEGGFPFRGILFLGLMLTADGAKVIEYNVRFGDPETQSILMRLDMNLTKICEAILNRNLNETKIKWKQGASVCVILAAKNYPAKPQTGDVICGLENVESDNSLTIFHSGTARNESGEFVTAGGRVLGVMAFDKTLESALQTAYAAIDKISFVGMQFRRDIGRL